MLKVCSIVYWLHCNFTTVPFERVVKGIFVNRELLVLFPVNCEITFEYDDDSSDDSDSVLEEDSAVPQLLNKELGFLFTAPRTRSGRMVRTSNKAVPWSAVVLNQSKKTDRIKTFFSLVINTNVAGNAHRCSEDVWALLKLLKRRQF